MLISAKTTRLISFFFFFSPKEAHLLFKQLKQYQPEILRRKNARAEKPNVGYPLMQFSVKLVILFSPHDSM